MSMYTRQHFRDIAEMIGKLPKKERKVEADKWARKFAASNPRFDKAKFMTACKVK